MDDTLRNIAIGLGAFLVLHISLESRARHAAERQVYDAFNHTGKIHASVEPRGMFGLEFNRLYSVDITGTHVRAERIPFYLYPRSGWKGSIRHLRLRLDDFTLVGLPITELTADIPNATYDLGYAFYRSRLVLHGADAGPVTVRISPEGLRTFILRKYNKILSDVEVSLNTSKIVIAGRSLLLGTSTSLSATAGLTPRDGRYIDLAEPDISINGKAVSPQFAAMVVKQINPVLDIVKDLNLGGFLQVQDVRIGEGEVIVTGSIGLPVAEPGAPPP